MIIVNLAHAKKYIFLNYFEFPYIINKVMTFTNNHTDYALLCCGEIILRSTKFVFRIPYICFKYHVRLVHFTEYRRIENNELPHFIAGKLKCTIFLFSKYCIF